MNLRLRMILLLLSTGTLSFLLPKEAGFETQETDRKAKKIEKMEKTVSNIEKSHNRKKIFFLSGHGRIKILANVFNESPAGTDRLYVGTERISDDPLLKINFHINPATGQEILFQFDFRTSFSSQSNREFRLGNDTLLQYTKWAGDLKFNLQLGGIFWKQFSIFTIGDPSGSQANLFERMPWSTASHPKNELGSLLNNQFDEGNYRFGTKGLKGILFEGHEFFRPELMIKFLGGIYENNYQNTRRVYSFTGRWSFSKKRYVEFHSLFNYRPKQEKGINGSYTAPLSGLNHVYSLKGFAEAAPFYVEGETAQAFEKNIKFLHESETKNSSGSAMIIKGGFKGKKKNIRYNTFLETVYIDPDFSSYISSVINANYGITLGDIDLYYNNRKGVSLNTHLEIQNTSLIMKYSRSENINYNAGDAHSSLFINHRQYTETIVPLSSYEGSFTLSGVDIITASFDKIIAPTERRYYINQFQFDIGGDLKEILPKVHILYKASYKAGTISYSPDITPHFETNRPVNHDVLELISAFGLTDHFYPLLYSAYERIIIPLRTTGKTGYKNMEIGTGWNWFINPEVVFYVRASAFKSISIDPNQESDLFKGYRISTEIRSDF